LGERARKARIIRNERAIQIKDIHDGYCSCKSGPSGKRENHVLTGKCTLGRAGFAIESPRVFPARTSKESVARRRMMFGKRRVEGVNQLSTPPQVAAVVTR
jgi:hypothetical protein